jgi:hypothetical protein
MGAIYTYYNIICVVKPEYIKVIRYFLETKTWRIDGGTSPDPAMYCFCDWLSYLRKHGHFRIWEEAVGWKDDAYVRKVMDLELSHEEVYHYLGCRPFLTFEYHTTPFLRPGGDYSEKWGNFCELKGDLWVFAGGYPNYACEIQQFINIILLNICAEGGIQRCWLSSPYISTYYNLSDSYLRENNLLVVEPPSEVAP